MEITNDVDDDDDNEVDAIVVDDDDDNDKRSHFKDYTLLQRRKMATI